MAGHLPKNPQSFFKIPSARLAIISSLWHEQYVLRMISRAKAELLRLEVKAENISLHQLPGSLELPYAAAVLFEHDPQLDAILAFGIVLKGATTHDDSVIRQVVNGFALVSDRFGKPIINEVIGVNNLADAETRSADDNLNKGLEAAFAVSEILHWRDYIKNNPPGVSSLSLP